MELIARDVPAAPVDRGAEAAIARAEQRFGLDLLRRLGGGDSSTNVVASPLSLAVALAMLETGARGPTLDQIARVLGTPGLSPGAQDAGWAALLGDLSAAAAKDGVTIRSANSLWLQRNLPMVATFMADMARYFRAGVWQVDFARDLPGATSAIDRWTSEHTAGKITRLFRPGDLSAATALVLANAVYFDGAWQAPFQASATADLPFHLPSGATVTVPFMQQQAPRTAVTTAYGAVELPYRGGRLAAVAIMPAAGTLPEFVAGLTPGRLDQIVAGLDRRSQIFLPRFTVSGYLDLKPTLEGMGMDVAFTGGADFSAMSPRGLAVQSAVQRDYLAVDEHGTKASAATGIGLEPTATVSVLRFDHPFLFVIRDTVTEAILFAARIENPTP